MDGWRETLFYAGAFGSMIAATIALANVAGALTRIASALEAIANRRRD